MVQVLELLRWVMWIGIVYNNVKTIQECQNISTDVFSRLLFYVV